MDSGDDYERVSLDGVIQSLNELVIIKQLGKLPFWAKFKYPLD